MTIAWLLSLLALACTAFAKQQVVMVGTDDDGEPRPLFTPAHVQLEAGDRLIFSFQISGSNHSVVQSSRDAPCAPMEGGFNSGYISGDSADSTTFALDIEGSQTPLFFYCAQVDAGATVPHCARGMWGSVNADGDALETYSEVIAAITAPPNKTPWDTRNSESVPSTTSSTTSTPRATPTNSSSERQSSSEDDSDGEGLGKGAIIGIALSSASCVAAAAAFWVYKRTQRRRRGISSEGIESSPPVYLSVEMQSDPGSSAGSRLTAVYEQVGGLTVMRAPSIHSQAPSYRTTLSSNPFASPEDDSDDPFSSPEDLETATLHSSGDVPPEYASSHSIPPSFHSHSGNDDDAR